MVALNGDQIFPGVHYRDNTEYGIFAGMRGACPAARRFSAEVVSLPMHLRMNRADVARVSERARYHALRGA
jgi:dTDP-4-amino-4,6-dideoxygalactose transaminase